MRKTVTAAVFALVACLALSAVALGSSVHGTNRKDRIRGTNGKDMLKARAGNDRVKARGGNDRVRGGSGRDRLNGGRGADRLAGNAGPDLITGGPGPDTITGGDGDDVIDASDGSVDAVTCGGGDEIAKPDEDDVIGDATAEHPNGSCETVLRGDDASGDPGEEHHSGRDCRSTGTPRRTTRPTPPRRTASGLWGAGPPAPQAAAS